MNPQSIRRIRLEKEMSLNKLSNISGFSKGYLSLIERGLKNPSLRTLRILAECFDVPIISFFIKEHQPNDNVITDNNEKYTIIYKDKRTSIKLPEILIEYQLITPISTNNDLEITGSYAEIDPGCWSSEKMVFHSYDECMYIIKGQGKMFIGKSEHNMKEGDCIYINKGAYHNFYNDGQEKLISILFSKYTL